MVEVELNSKHAPDFLFNTAFHMSEIYFFIRFIFSLPMEVAYDSTLIRIAVITRTPQVRLFDIRFGQGGSH